MCWNEVEGKLWERGGKKLKIKHFKLTSTRLPLQRVCWLLEAAAHILRAKGKRAPQREVPENGSTENTIRFISAISMRLVQNTKCGQR